MWRRSPACLRSLVAGFLAAGLMVLAAALVTPGSDVLRSAAAGPAIHPAAEITPNAMPRTCEPPADVHACAVPSGDGTDVGPLAAVVADPLMVEPSLASWATRAPVERTFPRASEPLAGGRAPPAVT